MSTTHELTARQASSRIVKFLKANDIAVRVTTSHGPSGPSYWLHGTTQGRTDADDAARTTEKAAAVAALRALGMVVTAEPCSYAMHAEVERIFG